MSITKNEAITIGMKLAKENDLVFECVHRFPVIGDFPAMYIINCTDQEGEQKTGGIDGICKAILEEDGSIVDFHMPVPE